MEQRPTRYSKSLDRIKSKVSFTIFGMHPDNGSKFISWTLVMWAEANGIELTRSRPFHKNDNANVEQKNGHVIRRFLGYTRIDQREVVSKMNELYNVLETYLNHFVPSRKIEEKVRIGSKYKRKYSKGKIAYRRVLKHQDISQEVKDKLIAQHQTLNPLILRRKVDMLINELFTLLLRSRPLNKRRHREDLLRQCQAKNVTLLCLIIKS